jgi:hypothetical protein
MGHLKRAWYGLRYIFGFQSIYGAFDEVLLEKREVEKLRDLCNDHLRRLNGEEDNVSSKGQLCDCCFKPAVTRLDSDWYCYECLGTDDKERYDHEEGR